MNFRTPMQATVITQPLRPYAPVLSTGSCFADNITARMRAALWQAYNPFGTLYNPVSVGQALRIALLDEEGDDTFAQSLFQSDDCWLSWMFDSRFAAPLREEIMENFRNMRRTAISLLRKGKLLLVTFGTAGCYTDMDSGRIVANCHKMPANRFSRFRLDVGRIVGDWDALIRELAETFPGLRVIFTVSPVRYVKDGFIDDRRSKATLLLAVEQICRHNPEALYFPAYELMMDDLRDYRFYAADMVHPSPQAADYIWEYFKHTMLSPDGLAEVEEGEKLAARLHHRPLLPWREENRKFTAETQRLAALFRQKNPEAMADPDPPVG